MCIRKLTAADERKRSDGERAGAVEEILREKRLAVAEGASRFSQKVLSHSYERVRATKHAPRDPFRLLERRHGFAQIVESGAGGDVKRPPVKRPHLERDFITFSDSTARHE